MRRAGRRLLPLLVLALAGCGGGGNGGAAATPTPTPAPPQAHWIHTGYGPPSLGVGTGGGSLNPGELIASDPQDGGVMAVVPQFAAGDQSIVSESAFLYKGGTWQPLGPVAPASNCVLLAPGPTGEICIQADLTNAGGNGPLVAFVWSSGQWHRIDGATPSQRSVQGALVFDPARKQDVYFDGSSTWTFNGSSWSLQNLSSEPQVSDITMGYDPVSRRVVLLGANEGTGSTWAWTGSGWAQLGTGLQNPYAVDPQVAGMATDPVTGRLITVSSNYQQTTADVWVLNADGSWSEVSSAKIPLVIVATDPGGGHVVAIDSNNRLYTWTATAPGGPSATPTPDLLSSGAPGATASAAALPLP